MTEIRVPWENQNNVWWNETCANIIEHFGLPGDKYTTEVSADEMKFFFKDDREALMCRILVSDRI
jgi:2-hydroxychromene-2-carboxylate isomerase